MAPLWRTPGRGCTHDSNPPHPPWRAQREPFAIALGKNVNPSLARRGARPAGPTSRPRPLTYTTRTLRSSLSGKNRLAWPRVRLSRKEKVENSGKFIATTANFGKKRLAWPRVRLSRAARSTGNLYDGAVSGSTSRPRPLTYTTRTLRWTLSGKKLILSHSNS